ncbi:hypothetical protein JG688_00011413, partial [Phytophthora aleatoria]
IQTRPSRGNALLFEELEEGQVDYEESVASEAHSHAASARSHTSGVSPGAASARSNGSTTMSPPRRALVPRIRSLNATTLYTSCAMRLRGPLAMRKIDDPNVITNDLDEAQSRQLAMEPSSQRLWILRRPRVVLRCSSWTLRCVDQPLRPISKRDGTRSASA